MKVPTNPFPKGKLGVRRLADKEERLRCKAQKRLEELDYTPLAARFLSGILRDLAQKPKAAREARLRMFAEIANEKG